MFLVVRATGARSWILRFWMAERRQDLGLGGYPEIGLADARDGARAARRLVREGINPIQHKHEAREAAGVAEAKRMTFEQAAIECHKVKSAEFKSAKHSADWLAALENHVFNDIGHIQVSQIDVDHVMKVLGPIWATKTETATRVRQRIEMVLAWALVAKKREGTNPARWSENLDQLLPTPSKVRKTRHQPALPYQRMGLFMASLRKRRGMGARALEFAILTAARAGEVRGAVWDEIDLDAKLWTIPAERMKAEKAHTIPLTDDAIRILKETGRHADTDVIFTALRGGKISDATMSKTIKNMHAAEIKAGNAGWIDPHSVERDSNGNKIPDSVRCIVPHGFRSTFKDWARACTRYPDEISELALAHVNSDATRSAYARDDLLPMRANMMADWAKYCDQALEPGSVSAIRERKA